MSVDSSSTYSQNPGVSYTDLVIGAATFDLNGLPKEYFTTGDNTNINWVQTIFQALGLRSLLMSSLQLEGFRHAVIRGSGYCAVVVKQRAYYIALLIQPTDAKTITESLIQWVQEFEPSELKANPRFHAA